LGPQKRAEELSEALRVAGLWEAYADGDGEDGDGNGIGKGPGVVLVGHSFGGTLVRAFLLYTLTRRGHQQNPSLRVAGLVLVDSMTSYPHSLDPPTSMAMLPGMGSSPAEYRTITGLEEHHVFSAEEYAAIVTASDNDEGRKTGEREAGLVVSGTDEINKALGLDGDAQGTKKVDLQEHENESENDDKKAEAAASASAATMLDPSARLGAIFCGAHYDFAKIVAHYRRTGRPEDVPCSDEEFAAAVSEVGEWTEMWAGEEESNKRRVLSLAKEGMSRFTIAEGNARTHNVQWVDPDLIVREVLWVVGGSEGAEVGVTGK